MKSKNILIIVSISIVLIALLIVGVFFATKQMIQGFGYYTQYSDYQWSADGSTLTYSSVSDQTAFKTKHAYIPSDSAQNRANYYMFCYIDKVNINEGTGATGHWTPVTCADKRAQPDFTQMASEMECRATGTICGDWGHTGCGSGGSGTYDIIGTVTYEQGFYEKVLVCNVPNFDSGSSKILINPYKTGLTQGELSVSSGTVTFYKKPETPKEETLIIEEKPNTILNQTSETVVIEEKPKINPYLLYGSIGIIAIFFIVLMILIIRRRR